MKNNKNIRRALIKDAAALAENIRYSDYIEIVEMHGYKKSIKTLIAQSIRESTYAYAYEVDGKVLALAGCAYKATAEFQGGVPWFICCEEFLENHKRVLVRHAPSFVQRFLKRYKKLINFVHADNTVSIYWLTRLGFTIHEEVVHGHFHKFTKEL